jgi:chorismate mutase
MRSLHVGRDDENMKDELQKFREEIDKIDNNIVDLLSKRMSVVEKVGKLKKKHNIEALDAKRWDEVLHTKLEKAKSLGVSERLIKKIYNVIHDHALRLEKKS